MKESKKLYCYAEPHTMQHHNFTDDVALCEAYSKEEACEIFNRMYNVEECFVEEVQFNSYGIYVATDY